MELHEKISLIRNIPAPLKEAGRESLLNLNFGSTVKLRGSTFIVDKVIEFNETTKKGNLRHNSWNKFRLVDLESFSISFLEIENKEQIIVSLTTEKVAKGRFHNNPSLTTKQLTVDSFPGIFYLDETHWARRSESEIVDFDKVTILNYEGCNGVLLRVEVSEDEDISAHTYERIDLEDIEVTASVK